MKPHMESGKLRVLAVSSKERLALAPDVPTVAETYSGFAEEFWFGVFTPAGVPTEIVSKLEETFRRVINSPSIKEKISGMALTPIGNSAVEMKRILATDYERFGRAVRENNISVE